jgi:hypothetical protein
LVMPTVPILPRTPNHPNASATFLFISQHTLSPETKPPPTRASPHFVMSMPRVGRPARTAWSGPRHHAQQLGTDTRREQAHTCWISDQISSWLTSLVPPPHSRFCTQPSRPARAAARRLAATPVGLCGRGQRREGPGPEVRRHRRRYKLMWRQPYHVASMRCSILGNAGSVQLSPARLRTNNTPTTTPTPGALTDFVTLDLQPSRYPWPRLPSPSCWPITFDANSTTSPPLSNHAGGVGN